MDTKSFLNISQLAFELDAGEAIIKFLIKRFKKWIPGIEDSGQTFYTQSSLIFLILILDKINKGILPSKIDEELNNGTIQATLPDEPASTDKYDIVLQKRNIKALEKRADAEEKKALAMEKSIEIEALKVEALNNIAHAISNFNTFPPQFYKNGQAENIYMADSPSQSYDNDKIIKEDRSDVEIDNLSVLIQKDESENLSAVEIDDLSVLLSDTSSDNSQLDDLSLLIEADRPEKNSMDDLSLLIKEEKRPTDDTIDDLSALIDFQPDDKPIIKKPDFLPEDDFENYKSEIINIIIDLKNQGYTEKETLEQFNKEGILTLSGKTKWSIKTISQIYQLINNAA